MAYICPKADGKWFKFNDEIVTKCSQQDAVQSNYGNNDTSSNAYILTYIKDSEISQILRDVTLDDVVSLDLIQSEMAKERIFLENRHLEMMIHTSEKLEMNDKIQRGNQLWDKRTGVSFAIEKDQTLNNLLQTLNTAFCLGPNTHKIVLWMVLMEKCAIRMINLDQHLNKNLSMLFKKCSANLFMEILPLEEPNSNQFHQTKHAVIFVKEYNAIKDSLTFVGHQYFKLQQTVQDIRAYIREITQYEGDDEDIAIIGEKGCGDNYNQHLLNDPKQLIQKFAVKHVDTFSAIITFEVLGMQRKSKYISAFLDHRSSIDRLPIATSGSYRDLLNRTANQKPITPMSDLVNGITITINHEGCELFTEKFEMDSHLFTIVEHIAEIFVSKSKNFVR